MAVHPLTALLPLAALIAAAQALQARPGAPTLLFALGAGALLGLVLQRARFCFFCHARDAFEGGDPRGLLAILLALAVGAVGYTVVLGSWLPVPGGAARLPPDIHIGPVSGVLVAAGLSFGLGMVISGSCISAHWYRLAEGSPVAPFALVGTAAGFVLGLRTWNPLYRLAVAEAPVVWLPAHLGYGGALALQLGVLGVIAAALWRGYAARSNARPAPETAASAATPAVASLHELWRRLWTGRWPYWLGGLGVGLIGVATLVRMRPLGVTTTLGSAARAQAQAAGWIPERLDGLDAFAGCATLPQQDGLTPHAVLLGGLLAGAFAGALASRQFLPRRPRARDVLRGLGGGLLLGWGAMTGLGCTIGTLLSGGMAGALSGWVWGAAMFFAVWAGLRAQRGLTRTRA